tara:strand:+ start:387 stop:1064 length:678 start_codon:yes stop_codon:yes gene_type:complete
VEIVCNSLKNQNLNHFVIWDCDISKISGVDLLFQKIPNDCLIKVLINNAAGNSKFYSHSDTVEERWDKTMNNDLKHIYLLTERVVVSMRDFGGSVINISSIAGNIIGSKSIPYAAAKSAITGLTKSFARVYGKYGIRVNSILPGVIANERTIEADSTGYFSQIKNQTPLNRWGNSLEIAEAAYFISSDKCSFLNGSNIVIDGGATLTLGQRIDEEIPFKWEKFHQ